MSTWVPFYDFNGNYEGGIETGDDLGPAMMVHDELLNGTPDVDATYPSDRFNFDWPEKMAKVEAWLDAHPSDRQHGLLEAPTTPPRNTRN